MNELFGIPMTTIMWALLVVFGACLVAVAAIFLTNRTMFRVGLRNIPRRRAQSTLVVLGLMLATLIITAAFTTGDTLDYSITSGVYDNLQRTDLRIDFRGEGGGDAAPGQIYADAAVVDRLSAAFADDPDIAGFFPFLFEPLPAVNRDTRLAEPAVVLAGIDPAALARFGGLRLSGGGRPDLTALGEDEVLVSERAANQLDARPGHTLLVYAQGQPHALRVAGIVKDELASGVLGFGGPDVPGGMAARLTTVQRIVGHPGQVNSVSVALKGEGRETVTRSGPAAQRLEAFLNSAEGRAALGLGELRARVDTSKADGLKQAETFGNLFTTFFLVLGLFSIAAGVLLIFMIFAMFSLIVFSITMMSVLNANFSALFSGEEARGGWDVTVDTNRNNRVPDLAAALRDEGTFDPGVIAEAARTTGNLGVQEARVAGNGDWQRYPVRAGDDAFFAANQAKLDLRARGYASDREVFEAVRTQPNLALIDILAVPNNGNVGAGPDLFKLTGLTTSDKEFDPITVEVRDPVTGRQGTLTVIGVFSSKIPQRVLFGLYTNERSYAAIFGPPEYRRFYLRLQPGANGEAVAKGIKAALVTRGVQARSIATDIDEQMRLGRGFNRIFQAFMGLGLFVGIAALGVIAFRSVVERRQQIGMLRALGYQRGTVALTFVLESSFVALMGILSGVVGAAILARNLFNSDAFTGTSRTGFSFFIPWGEVVVFVAIAYLCALLMTWWPSRGAARVPVAEALRYE